MLVFRIKQKKKNKQFPDLTLQIFSSCSFFRVSLVVPQHFPSGALLQDQGCTHLREIRTSHCVSRDFKRQPASDIPWCSSRVATIFHITSLKKRISFLWAANPLGRKTCEMRVTQFCSRNLTPSQIDKERQIDRERELLTGFSVFCFFFGNMRSLQSPNQKRNLSAFLASALLALHFLLFSLFLFFSFLFSQQFLPIIFPLRETNGYFYCSFLDSTFLTLFCFFCWQKIVETFLKNRDKRVYGLSAIKSLTQETREKKMKPFCGGKGFGENEYIKIFSPIIFWFSLF